MPQAVQLMKDADPDELRRSVDDGVFRAAAFFPFGCFQGIAFTHELGVERMSAPMSCVPPDCILGIGIPGVLSNQLPDALVAFAVLTLRPGTIEQVLTSLDEADERRPDGVRSLWSPLYGTCEPLLVVEVLGPDDGTTLTHLHRLVDHEGVTKAETLVTVGDLTWGFGTEAQPARLAGAQPDEVEQPPTS